MLEEQWTAITYNDQSFDGSFYYAVTTTRIFCRPSCRSKNPKKENIRIFATSNAAMEADFRPCKRCRPNLLSSPAEQLVHDAKQYMESHYGESLSLGKIAQKLYVSKYHLHHLFTRTVGSTPSEYLLEHRLKIAKRLLEETDQSVMEISASVGFPNPAHFSTVFRKQLGYSPCQYRSETRVTITDFSLLNGK